jgi:hypothetical protein
LPLTELNRPASKAIPAMSGEHGNINNPPTLRGTIDQYPPYWQRAPRLIFQTKNRINSAGEFFQVAVLASSELEFDQRVVKLRIRLEGGQMLLRFRKKLEEEWLVFRQCGSQEASGRFVANVFCHERILLNWSRRSQAHLRGLLKFLYG